MAWSTTSDSPLPASTLATTPSAAANSTFSIFMASITATRSPACTFWPTCTATSTSRPGMGESTYRLMSGGALNGMSRCSSAMRRDTTTVSMRVPLCCTTRASGLRSVPRSTWAVKAWPLHSPVMQTSFRREGLLMAKRLPSTVTTAEPTCPTTSSTCTGV